MRYDCTSLFPGSTAVHLPWPMICEQMWQVLLLHGPHHTVLIVESMLPWRLHQPGSQETLMSRAPLLSPGGHMAWRQINLCWLSHRDYRLFCYLSITNPSWQIMKVISRDRSEEIKVWAFWKSGRRASQGQQIPRPQNRSVSEVWGIVSWNRIPQK